jgi:acyl-CoA synthetase (AMP-forming)/AMP-acid ligase II
MAENTLIVSGGQASAPPVLRQVEKAALGQNRAVPLAAEGQESQTIVGCGHSWLEQKIVIVDPQSLTLCRDGQVGEIWVAGASVAQGYWNRPEQTQQTFRAQLATPPLKLGGDKGGGALGRFLRTGDLGFLQTYPEPRRKESELFVTGRLKDLIIIRGRNHYPQDIELTVEKSHPALTPGSGAAFSVEIEGQERLVIVQEVKRAYHNENVHEVISAIGQAVTKEHQCQVYAILLLERQRIPKTRSVKNQRHACRAGFWAGTLATIGEWRETRRREEFWRARRDS